MGHGLSWRRALLALPAIVLVLSSASGFDLSDVPTTSLVELTHAQVTLPCESPKLHVRRLEWRCRGCFSISASKESRLAVLENNVTMSLIYPDRFTIVRSQRGPGFSLNIKPAATGDSGTYFCLVNGKPEPFSAYTLAVQDVPSTPGKPLIMKFDSRSVELSWSPPLHVHFSEISHYIIHIREGEETDWSHHQVVTTSSAETSYNVTDLAPFTVYSFKVTAVNSIGASNESLASYHMMTLREEPSGKPTITAAHNISSNSIKLSWRPPEKSSINGEFLGYQVSWRERSVGQGQEVETASHISSVQLRDPLQTQHVISGLATYTQYLVSLQVINPKGAGPSSTVVVMTNEGVPSSPLNISQIHITNSSVTLHWRMPVSPNGVVAGYRLYYMTKQVTDVVTVKDTAEEVIYRLLNLSPYTKYSVWVKAFTSKHEGNSSATLEVLTDVSGPGRSLITNLTCPGDSSLYVEWAQPEQFYHGVDRYNIFIKTRQGEDWEVREVIVPPVTKHNVEKMLFSNLSTNQEYLLKIQALTSSLYQENLVYPGKISEAHSLVVSRNCDGILVSPMREEARPGAGATGATIMVSLAIVIGASVVFIVLLIAVVTLAFYRRRKMRNRFYIPGSISARDDMPLWDLESLDQESLKSSVPGGLWVQHCTLLAGDSNLGYRKELEYIVSQSASAPSVSSLSASERRNEAAQVSFVDGYENRKMFCVSDLHLENETKTNALWNFITEKNIHVVIMSEINEFMLFSKSVDEFSPIGMIAGTELAHSGFLVKTFKIKRKKNSKKVEDHTVSVYCHTPAKLRGKAKLDFLRMVKHSQNMNKTAGLILLSDSSSSLSYMAVFTMLHQLGQRRDLSLVSWLVTALGQARGLSPPSLHQYVFIHEVLADAVMSGNTTVDKTGLVSFLHSLDDRAGEAMAGFPCWEPLEKQFSVATELGPDHIGYLTAVNPANQLHNNSMDYVAGDHSRVMLQPPVSGTDYVNASWVPGYSGDRAFIISQHPNNFSLEQFWHMVWQTDTRTIICLSAFQQPFWPHFNNPLVLAGLRLVLEAETSSSGYQAVSLRLETQGEQHSVQVVFCPNWPHLSVPVSNCVHLVDCVTRLAAASPDKPTLVMDSFGATEAAIFTVLASLVRMLDTEEWVDIFHWFKCVHLARPGVWVSPDNLLFLYRVMGELCTINKGTLSTSDINTSIATVPVVMNGFEVNI